MARNQEKQQGKLNRLWLQKERDEGRLKDVHERRPKLSTLNSAASLKKWIPSIKNEIEYYLQQSQLSHYPERKIAEFQLHMEALEREYKRFIAKLRAVDPGCKHKPWTPRAYCRRRADTRESPANAAPPRPPESRDGDSAGGGTGCHDPSVPESQPPPGVQTPADQDRPLSFDRARLAVAAAAFRGPPPPPQGGSSSSQTLAQVLHSGLPNLSNASARRGGAAEDREDHESHAGTTGHVLGLDCYSSSDEEH